MKPTAKYSIIAVVFVAAVLGIVLPTELTAQTATPVADSLLSNQMPDQALPLYETAAVQYPDSGRIWFSLGYCRHSQKMYTEAIPAYLRADSLGVTPAVTRYNIGCAHSLLGNIDQAFSWLDRALEVGFTALQTVETDTDLDPLRSDPRFAAFMEKVEYASAPCEHDPNCRQLDFWIGDWTVYNQYGAFFATDTITKDMRGCALIEDFVIGNAFHGHSLNFFDPKLKKWRMEWVDQTGTVILMTGAWDGKTMRYEGERIMLNGTENLIRLDMSPLPDGSVHQLVRRSTDNGATWTTSFDLTFRKPAPSMGQK
jgi:hypothetical protein